MRWIGYAWTAVTWFFLLSVVSAGVIGLIRKAKARGKRKFATEPTARVVALHPDTRIDHRWDGA